MVFPSSWISQSIQAQNSMFSGMQAFSQQASASGGLMNGGPPSPAAMGGVSPPPPPATLMAVMRGYGGYGGGPTAGAFGEAMAGRMASMGQTGMGLAGAGMAGLGAAGSLGLIGGPMGAMASMMDPMGLAMRAGMGGFSAAGGGFGGAAMGLGAAGAVALPLYAGAQYAGALASNFRGGMQDQMSLNSTLRGNFNFMGGQGAYGRGFSQTQMGQIGSAMGGMMRSDHMISGQGELNELVSGGAAMGSFTGVRDVQTFTRRFREMISTLRTVQRELGGSLQEAQEFVNQSRQAGVFGSTAATRFASTIRNTSAVTGMDQGQLLQLASSGASIARTFGGLGRQGATGALRGVTSVGTALNSGMISESMLSEATGGLTGTEAMSTFVTNMMQRTGERSRSGHGRYGIFGLSNSTGTGLDEEAMMRFQMGDMGVGDLSRRAHTRVGEMGRARAVNREGILRGAAIEQGGLSFQIGMARQLLGNDGAGMSSDLMSQVLQRRGHMSRPESEVMASMIRNQGTIARTEIDERIGSRREESLRTEVREHRSLDAFQREIGHELQEGLGLNRARELGRNFVTGVSSRIERAMNTMLGIVDEGMTSEVRGRMGRLGSGAGTARDLRMIDMATAGADTTPRISGANAFNTTMFQRGPSVGSMMMAAGFNVGGFGVGEAGRDMREMGVRPGGGRVTGVHADGSRIYAGGAREMTGREFETAATRLTMAAGGRATGGRAEELLEGMGGENTATTRRSILNAMAAAEGRGDVNQFMSFVGGRGRRGESALTEDRGVALTAFMAREGMDNPIMLSSAALEMAGRGDDTVMGRLGETWDSMFGEDPSATVGTGETRVTAEEYFTAGGGVGAELRGEAERLRMGTSATGRAMDLNNEQRLSAAHALEGRAAMLGGIDSAAMGEVMGRADVRRASEMLLSDDADERQRGADLLGELTGAEGVGTDARAALNSLRENADLLVADGDTPDPSRRSAFMSVAIPHEEMVAMRRETAHMRSSFRSIAAAFDEDDPVRQMFEQAGSAATGGGMFRSIEDSVTEMSLLSDTDFASRMASMGGAMSGVGGEENQDRLRSLMMNATAEHGRARDIMGRGRRGRRGGREAALSMATGGSLADMSFEIGGRAVGGRNVADMLLGGGRHSEEMMAQLRTQLGAAGLDTAAVEDVTSTLSSAYASGGPRGPGGEEVTEDEMRSLAAMRDRHGDAFDRIAREGHERALGAAQARDPVGAETNRLLGEINTGIRAIAPADPSSPPNTSTEPNMSGGT